MISTIAAYIVAIYVRLSKEDDRGDESVSIENQKSLLVNYVESQPGWILHEVYVDDGWSGVNFQRPGFMRMIEDAKSGVINLILVKDMSRFGRNFIESGQFMEYVLPAIGCRLVALHDNYDSINGTSGGNEFIHFKNFFNELHCRDTSNKVKTVRKDRAKSGKFMGSRAPYGYKKDAKNKHQFVIDEPAAMIVRRIFEMRCEGYGFRAIAIQLNSEGVLPPRETYYNEIGKENPLRGNGLWTDSVIMRLTKNEAYLGNMVQFKTGSISFKNKKLVSKPQDEWVRVENTHTPIIEQAVWDRAQEITATKRKPRRMNSGPTNIYAGLLWCADCGTAMRGHTRIYRHKEAPETKQLSYICGSYGRSGKQACTAHTITKPSLTEIILADIRANAALISMDEDAVRRELNSRLNTQASVSLRANRMELEGLTNRLGDLTKLIPTLYEDKVNGTLPESVFANLLDKYERERLDKSDKASTLRKKIAEDEQSQADASEWIRLMKKYAHIDTLSTAVLLDLVSRIEIGDAMGANGVKYREVKIFYRFIKSAGLAAMMAEAAEVRYAEAG